MLAYQEGYYMSALLMGRAFYVPLDQSSRLVLLALCDHAQDDGVGARPGLKRIGTKTGLSRRAVQNVLAHLEAHGLIVARGYRKGGRGFTTNWIIETGMIRLWADLYEDDPDEYERVQEMHRSEKGASCDRKGCSLVPERVQHRAPQPSGIIKNQEEIENEAPEGGIVAEFHRRIKPGS